MGVYKSIKKSLMLLGFCLFGALSTNGVILKASNNVVNNTALNESNADTSTFSASKDKGSSNTVVSSDKKLMIVGSLGYFTATENYYLLPANSCTWQIKSSGTSGVAYYIDTITLHTDNQATNITDPDGKGNITISDNTITWKYKNSRSKYVNLCNSDTSTDVHVNTVQVVYYGCFNVFARVDSSCSGMGTVAQEEFYDICEFSKVDYQPLLIQVINLKGGMKVLNY